MLVRAPIDDIMAGLTDGYSYHYQDRQHQHQHGNAGRGRFQRRHPRGQGAPAAAADAPAMASANAGAGGEERRCYNCNRQGVCRRTVTNYTQKSVSGSNSKLHEAVAVDAPQQRPGARRASGCCYQHS